MSRTTGILFASTAVLTLAGCADLTNSGANTLAVGSAFQSVPLGLQREFQQF